MCICYVCFFLRLCKRILPDLLIYCACAKQATTKVVKGGDPRWGETFEMPVSGESERPMGQSLVVRGRTSHLAVACMPAVCVAL